MANTSSVVDGKKRCNLCSEWKDVSEFPTRSKADARLKAYCKECYNIKHRSYYENNPIKFREKADKYRKKNRPVILKRLKEWRSRNKQRQSEYGRRYRAKHPEFIKELWRKYRDRRPDVLQFHHRMRWARLKGANGKFTPKEFEELCAKYGNKCLCCGVSGVPLDADHVVPISRGGENVIENIQPLCHHCNCVKYIGSTDYRPDSPNYVFRD